MTIVTIHDAEDVGGLTLGEDLKLQLTHTKIEFRSHAAIVWTDKIGGFGDEPDRLIINTMSQQLVYTNPRLIFYSNRLIVLSALSDRDPSGTLRTIRKYYIELDNSCDN